MKFVLTAVFALVSPSAYALDFGTLLLGSDGKPLPECLRLNTEKTKCEEEVNLTLGLLVRFALDMPEERIALSDIIKRGSLSEKIKANDKLDLSVDEAKLAKDQIVKLNYRTGVKFQAIKLIDPKGIEDGK